MYTVKLISLFFLILNLVNLTNTFPVESSLILSNNGFESPSLSPSISQFEFANKAQKTEVKSETSETISKILRLMHSLSNKSILVSPPGSLTSSHNSNFDLNEVKRMDDLKLKQFIESKDRLKDDLKDVSKDQLKEELNFNKRKNESNLKILNDTINENLGEQLNKKSISIKKLNEKLDSKLQNGELNSRFTHNERVNDHFNNDENQSTEDNLNEKFYEKILRNQFYKKPQLIKEFSLSTKYPLSNEQFNQRVQNPTLTKLSEIIRPSNDDIHEDSLSRFIAANPVYVKLFPNLNNVQTNEEQNNESAKQSKEVQQIQLSKDHKKNLYDMVENEEEDNGEEEHMHNYNISQLSDRELNRTLIDVQWLLNNNQNLSKQDIQNKFSTKGRNNRNKIAQRMEYFDKLYRNIHHLTFQTNKRTEGPQLSVVSPLDVLRDKLILEIARRKIEQSKSQMKENEDLLKKIG